MERDRREENRKEKRGGRRSRDLKVEEGAGMCMRGGRRSMDVQERWMKEQVDLQERGKKKHRFSETGE